jgi:hypothetical protein
MTQKRYRAKVDLYYRPFGRKGVPEKHAEPGDDCSDLPKTSFRHELEAEHIEEVTDQ